MKRVAWIGTGIMGRSMCLNLIEAGYEVSVYNRTRARAAELEKRGATWCDSPAAATESAEAVFTIVGYPVDVEEVYFGEDGILDACDSGTVLVDMTTSEPSLAQRIAVAGAERDLPALDAPVSGGDVGAKNGTLAIMVGGDEDAFERMLPAFQVLGENVRLMGPAGAGQHTKMCNQTLVAGTMIGVVESLLYAYRAGLDPDSVIGVIGKGAASSFLINNLGPRIARGDYDPGFYIEHFVKDMGIALAEAQRMNLSMPGLSLVHQFYLSAKALGWEKLGTQGLYRVLAHMNGIDT
ncbi:MAG: NAD(P)-dependent oxidoreductase [Spirochaetaceae bacterium]